MTTARLSRRRRQISQRTIATTVILAAMVLLFEIYTNRDNQESVAEQTVALTPLPAVTVAEPDPSRTPYDRKAYQRHGWTDADGDG